MNFFARVSAEPASAAITTAASRQSAVLTSSACWQAMRRVSHRREEICSAMFHRSIVEDWSGPHDDSCSKERVILAEVAESKQSTVSVARWFSDLRFRGG